MNHGGQGSSTLSKQYCEVAVESYQDPPRIKRCFQDRGVARVPKPQLTNMLHVIDRFPQQLDQPRRKVVVQKKLQLPDARDSSRSRTASAANRSASGTSSASRSG